MVNLAETAYWHKLFRHLNEASFQPSYRRHECLILDILFFRLCLLFLGNYSCLKVDLIFTRDRSFYFTTVFIPGIILVTSSFITFWLEWNAVPARVMIGWCTFKLEPMLKS